MDVRLLYPDRDFIPSRIRPDHEQDLAEDLGLGALIHAMTYGDHFMVKAARNTLLTLTDDPRVILYRQDCVRDCLRNPGVIRELYRTAVETLEKRSHYLGLSSHPVSMLHSAVDLMKMLMGQLDEIRAIAGQKAGRFRSEGFLSFFAMVRRLLDDEYLASLHRELRELEFPYGTLISAGLGSGNKGDWYRLRKANRGRTFMERLSDMNPLQSFTVRDRDAGGHRILTEIKDMGIDHTARILTRANEDILDFMGQLRFELAFYIGCANLHEKLARLGLPTAYPRPEESRGRLSFRGLYDPCLALNLGSAPVGNDLTSEAKDFILVTGANQGGKSTWLRSVGIAQLMMQCGMFVPARDYSSELYSGLFTHFKREEDAALERGKLEEELSRMSAIVDRIRPHAVVLLNESFAATNEWEGSQIAGQIIGALRDIPVKILYVTHLYTFAQGCRRDDPHLLFLRAQRLPDGTRTYRILEGEPQRTSFGEDLYRDIFGDRTLDGRSAPVL